MTTQQFEEHRRAVDQRFANIMTSHRRIVVTGYGAVTPYGVGVETFWNALLENRSGIAETNDPELRQWAPVTAQALTFEPEQFLSKKQIQDTDRATQLALVAAHEALQHAKLIHNDDAKGRGGIGGGLANDRIGIALGTAFGGIRTFEEGAVRLATAASRVSPRLVSKSLPNAVAAGIAMRYGVQGPVMTYSTACASAANAIGEGANWLKLGDADMVIAGGSECLFTPAILAGLKAAGALATTGPDDFSAWSRPFDVHRAGMVMGEGAAMLVLEPIDKALARGAKIYAELAGYGASNDAYHETAPHPEGDGAVLAMQRALRSAAMKPEDIDYINAHATATPAGDAAESNALKRVFGDHLNQTPVSSIKGAVGHMLGTAGAIESIACIQTLQTGWIPCTLHCDEPDPSAPPDVVSNVSRLGHVNRAMSNSFGFGGQNGVLIWQRSE